ncbi:hypothetical protein ZWY2020_015131 [Hordeum vulgare]|nr:hypothetical protein ZWY2020_015131 [Hordeum vulgare]
MSSAVDAILAEAADLVALEQIARLNTAHLAGLDDAALLSSLESRFRKLKSLPPPPRPRAARQDHGPERHRAAAPRRRSCCRPAPSTARGPPCAGRAGEPRAEGAEPPPQPRADPPKTSVPAVQEDEEEDLERLFGAGRGRPTLRERNRGRDDDGGSRTAAGGAPGDVLGIDAGAWGDENRRVVTELKEQQRQLKKALEEQVKVSRETAKMARWVKQASARMTHTDAIDDLLSDIDDDDELK